MIPAPARFQPDLDRYEAMIRRAAEIENGNDSAALDGSLHEALRLKNEASRLRDEACLRALGLDVDLDAEFEAIAARYRPAWMGPVTAATIEERIEIAEEYRASWAAKIRDQGRRILQLRRKRNAASTIDESRTVGGWLSDARGRCRYAIERYVETAERLRALRAFQARRARRAA